MLPEKMFHFSAGKDGGGGLSLVRWVKPYDWAAPSPTAAADQNPLQASVTITPGMVPASTAVDAEGLEWGVVIHHCEALRSRELAVLPLQFCFQKHLRGSHYAPMSAALCSTCGEGPCPPCSFLSWNQSSLDKTWQSKVGEPSPGIQPSPLQCFSFLLSGVQF